VHEVLGRDVAMWYAARNRTLTKSVAALAIWVCIGALVRVKGSVATRARSTHAPERAFGVAQSCGELVCRTRCTLTRSTVLGQPRTPYLRAGVEGVRACGW
jgi:hypothetical protein